MNGKQEEAFAWQVGIWGKMADTYIKEIDSRFEPVIDAVIERAKPAPGERILDLGTGTGSLAIAAAQAVGPGGHVIASDISPEMLALATGRFAALGIANAEIVEGRAEAIPAADNSLDAVLASLSLMYVIDRATAAREIARILRPGGRLVAAVWGGPEDTDIVLFQQTAANFAPEPPVADVGPGALADLEPFLKQFTDAGLRAEKADLLTRFHFDDFASAWEALAGVTAAALDQSVQDQAKSAVKTLMWPDGDGPREFVNRTQIITALKTA